METENHSPRAGASGAVPTQPDVDLRVLVVQETSASGAKLKDAVQAQQQKRIHHNEPASSEALRKLKATTVAELARHGFGLLELADGSFLVTRWTCCRPLRDLRAARAFLKQIGGAR